MVTLGKRARTLETAANPNHHHQINENGETQTPTDDSQNVSGYEQFRAERIKENLDRMQKLGILDLSLKLKSLKPTPKNSPSYRKTPQHLSQLPPSGAIRRSSRLQNATPVSYSEEHLAKRETFLEGEHDFLREGSKPEVYTEEHEKLLGNTERSWTLFVDGYGKDGRRIYDQVKGKTCHQCRQKTLGHRTHCSTCNMVQGQFCGDCLYMRYGEHVLEAKENPNWICPACRGICNCSLCRQAKGWPPTGCLYKKISKLGFKSVAHYLIQTRRLQTDSGKNPGINVPVSAKRTLPFSDMGATAEEKESPESKDDQGLINPNDKDNKIDDESKGKKEEEMHFPDNEHESNIALESSLKPKKKPALAIGASEDHQGSSKPESEDEKIDDEFKGKKEEELRVQENKHADSNIAMETSPDSENKPAHVTEASYVHQDFLKPESEDNKTVDEFKHGDYNIGLESCPKSKKKPPIALEHKHGDYNIALESCPKSKKKPPLTPEQILDSIAGRLRQRRDKVHGHDERFTGMKDDSLDARQAVNNISSGSEAEANTSSLHFTSPTVDSIAGRMKRRGQRA